VLEIPKNGSSTLQEVCKYWGWKRTTFYEDDWPMGPSAAVVRDPVDRFVSGLLQVMRGGVEGYGDRRIFGEELVVGKMAALLDDLEQSFFEPHTTPQSYWLVWPSSEPLKLGRIYALEDLQLSWGLVSQYLVESCIRVAPKNQAPASLKAETLEAVEPVVDRLRRLYAVDFELHDAARAAGPERAAVLVRQILSSRGSDCARADGPAHSERARDALRYGMAPVDVQGNRF
jgi:hypothetical protein